MPGMRVVCVCMPAKILSVMLKAPSTRCSVSRCAASCQQKRSVRYDATTTKVLNAPDEVDGRRYILV